MSKNFLESAVKILEDHGLNNDDNRAIVSEHANPYDLAHALSSLHRAGILTPENREVVTRYEYPLDLASALVQLHMRGILTPVNRQVVAGHAEPLDLASAFNVLRDAGILTLENRQVVAKHAEPSNLAFSFSALNQAGILTPVNRQVVAGHAEPFVLASTVSYLRGAGILTQANFDALLAPNHAVLLSDDDIRLFERIPRHLLTQENFEGMLTASEQANPLTALETFLRQILGVGAVAAPQQPFNQAQSTHTASVHASVSKSAGNLMTAYGDKIQGGDLDKAINEIKVYVNQLDDSPKHQAAKRAIERLTQPHYTFTDTSRVSTRQLLALAWLAIHDNSKRLGTLEDALNLFVEGLYEIQRGYNLNEAGVDNMSPNDQFICSGGTFNKIVEKLVGIHPDVDVKFITKEGAATKFISLAEHHTLACLKELASRNPHDASELINALKEAGNLVPIWDLIKERVKTELWDEFKEAYGNHPEHQHFQDLITYGNELPIPDEAKLIKILPPSQGAHSFFKSDDGQKKKPESPKP